MPKMVVQVPNGTLAIFSSIMDDFVVYNMNYEEAIHECKEMGMTTKEATDKVQRGIDNGPARWEGCKKIIENVHGKQHLRKVVRCLMEPDKFPPW